MLSCLRLILKKQSSCKKKEPTPKLFGPDIFGWGGGFPREGVGAKKLGMSLETREIKLFWQDIPGFCRDILGVPEKLEKKVCVQFSSPKSTRSPREIWGKPKNLLRRFFFLQIASQG